VPGRFPESGKAYGTRLEGFRNPERRTARAWKVSSSNWKVSNYNWKVSNSNWKASGSTGENAPAWAESASIRTESLIMEIFTVIDGEKKYQFFKEITYA
jgi:hypothetical protein